MKILKIFGIVTGIHLFALILIFANPGCSSSTRPAPTPMDTVSVPEPGPQIAVPPPASDGSLLSPAPIAFNPDAPAVAANAGGGSRYSPTRPNTPEAGTLLAEPPADITPATTHTVKSGESIDAIARRYGVRSAEIVRLNNVRDAARIQPGLKLIIPSKPIPKIPPSTVSGTAAPVGNDTTLKASANQIKHTVQPNEALSTIARRYGVRLSDLATLNNLNDPNKIKPGMELIIPDSASTKSGKSAQKSNGQAASSTKAGETPASTPPPAPAPAPTTPVEQTPPPAIDIPVIRVDESPLTPAPLNP